MYKDRKRRDDPEGEGMARGKLRNIGRSFCRPVLKSEEEEDEHRFSKHLAIDYFI
jgi:hypothetical protein